MPNKRIEFAPVGRPTRKGAMHLARGSFAALGCKDEDTMTSISDPEFDQNITLRESFFVLAKFLEQFNARGPTETDLVASWLELQTDGATADPAQLDDYLKCARAILARSVSHS